jgi:DNA-binding transcriptional LysR family regulator
MLKNINLNLLTVLHALLKTGSVSEAAELVNRTPSAVSSSLSQLREVLQDPLFVRVGSRLQATERAAQLRPPVEKIMEEIDSVFDIPVFEASKSTREFVVASSDIFISEFGFLLTKKLRQEAPNVSVQFVEIHDDMLERIYSREIDFAILPEVSVQLLKTEQLCFEKLGEAVADQVLMGPDHPLAKRDAVTINDLEGFPNIRFRPNQILTKGLKDASFDVPTSISVEQSSAIPRLLEDTDLCGIVPRCIARREQQNEKLVSVELVPESIVPFGLAWANLSQNDDAHIWFRALALALSDKGKLII